MIDLGNKIKQSTERLQGVMSYKEKMITDYA